MYGYEELVHALDYLTDEERQKVDRAFVLAERAHRGMNRKSGEPYITHPVAVAMILAELKMDADGVCAGLLHDTVEDTDVTFEELEEAFGHDVRKIVEGETKVSKLTKLSKNLQDEQAENLRQMLMAMTGDLRIIIVKLADRLHNMRTLGSMPEHKQKRISRETLEIFAPLAHRLGIGQIKWELEDLCFKYLFPEEFESLVGALNMRKSERENHIQKAIEQIKFTLGDDLELTRWVIKIEISGRSKHLYSIHNKMVHEHKSLEQIFDLLAIRVILTPKPVNASEINFDSAEEYQRALEMAELGREKRVCYHTLGIVHSMWTPIPGRFKDYIAVPKPNGYQSLHTTVISLSGLPIEVQIRSARMHYIAEYGVAAHWLYKQDQQGKTTTEQKINWLNQLEQLQQEITDASDFIDAVKNDLLSGRVFVFTPKGDTVNLPKGATPIDFAYHIHSRVGDTCVGSIVNGQIVPLNYELQNGDRLEILTSKNATPSKDWMNFAVTRSARTKIRHFFRTKERQDALQNGHDQLENYLRKRNLAVRQLMRTKLLEDVAEKLLGSRNPDELYLAIHSGRMNPANVAKVLAPQLEAEQTQPVVKQPLKRKAPPKQKDGGIIIDGVVTDAKVAHCCNPIVGDQIMGYLTRGRGVSVHRADCPNLQRLLRDEPDRCVDATWSASNEVEQLVDLDIICTDRPNLLAEVLQVITEQRRNVLHVTAGVGSGGIAHIYLRTTVRGNNDLSVLADALKRNKDIQTVLRMSGTKGGMPIPPKHSSKA